MQKHEKQQGQRAAHPPPKPLKLLEAPGVAAAAELVVLDLGARAAAFGAGFFFSTGAASGRMLQQLPCMD